MVTIRALAVNALVGLVILLISNAVSLGVQISVVTLLICAILGVPGAIIVMLLSVLDIAFMATLASMIWI